MVVVTGYGYAIGIITKWKTVVGVRKGKFQWQKRGKEEDILGIHMYVQI